MSEQHPEKAAFLPKYHAIVSELYRFKDKEIEGYATRSVRNRRMLKRATVPSENSSIEFIESSKGNRVLVYENYLFHLGKKNSDKDYWSCIRNRKKECYKRISTRNDQFYASVGEHNHPPENKMIACLHFRKLLKARIMENAEAPIPTIYKQTVAEAKEQNPETSSLLPSYRSVQSEMYRIRMFCRTGALDAANNTNETVGHTDTNNDELMQSDEFQTDVPEEITPDVEEIESCIHDNYQTTDAIIKSEPCDDTNDQSNVCRTSNPEEYLLPHSTDDLDIMEMCSETKNTKSDTSQISIAEKCKDNAFNTIGNVDTTDTCSNALNKQSIQADREKLNIKEEYISDVPHTSNDISNGDTYRNTKQVGQPVDSVGTVDGCTSESSPSTSNSNIIQTSIDITTSRVIPATHSLNSQGQCSPHTTEGFRETTDNQPVQRPNMPQINSGRNITEAYSETKAIQPIEPALNQLRLFCNQTINENVAQARLFQMSKKYFFEKPVKNKPPPPPPLHRRKRFDGSFVPNTSHIHWSQYRMGQFCPPYTPYPANYPYTQSEMYQMARFHRPAVHPTSNNSAVIQSEFHRFPRPVMSPTTNNSASMPLDYSNFNRPVMPSTTNNPAAIQSEFHRFDRPVMPPTTNKPEAMPLDYSNFHRPVMPSTTNNPAAIQSEFHRFHRPAINPATNNPEAINSEFHRFHRPVMPPPTSNSVAMQSELYQMRHLYRPFMPYPSNNINTSVRYGNIDNNQAIQPGLYPVRQLCRPLLDPSSISNINHEISSNQTKNNQVAQTSYQIEQLPTPLVPHITNSPTKNDHLVQPDLCQDKQVCKSAEPLIENITETNNKVGGDENEINEEENFIPCTINNQVRTVQSECYQSSNLNRQLGSYTSDGRRIFGNTRNNLTIQPELYPARQFCRPVLKTITSSCINTTMTDNQTKNYQLAQPILYQAEQLSTPVGPPFSDIDTIEESNSSKNDPLMVLSESPQEKQPFKPTDSTTTINDTNVFNQTEQSSTPLVHHVIDDLDTSQFSNRAKEDQFFLQPDLYQEKDLCEPTESSLTINITEAFNQTEQLSSPIMPHIIINDMDTTELYNGTDSDQLSVQPVFCQEKQLGKPTESSITINITEAFDQTEQLSMPIMPHVTNDMNTTEQCNDTNSDLFSVLPDKQLGKPTDSSTTINITEAFNQAEQLSTSIMHHAIIDRGSTEQCTGTNSDQFLVQPGSHQEKQLGKPTESSITINITDSFNQTEQLSTPIMPHAIHDMDTTEQCTSTNSDQFLVQSELHQEKQLSKPTITINITDAFNKTDKDNMNKLDREKNFGSLSCSSRVGDSYQNTNTERSEMGLEEKLTCPECSMKFTAHKNMLRHQRTKHENVKNFQCPECLKSFCRRDKFKDHIESHKHKALTTAYATAVKRPRIIEVKYR